MGAEVEPALYYKITMYCCRRRTHAILVTGRGNKRTQDGDMLAPIPVLLSVQDIADSLQFSLSIPNEFFQDVSNWHNFVD